MTLESQPKIILASTSPQRIEILKAAKLEFTTITPEYKEIANPFLSAKEQAKLHAFNKAKSVADVLKEGIVIGCDTIVSLNGKNLGKPKSKEEVQNNLEAMSSNKITVISGLCVFNAAKQRNMTTTAESIVEFTAMTAEDVQEYIDSGEWKDKAGGIAVEGMLSRYITNISGEYYNIIGLPIATVFKAIKTL